MKMNRPIHFNNQDKYNLLEEDFCISEDIVEIIDQVMPEIVLKKDTKKDINLLTAELKKCQFVKDMLRP